MRYVGDSIVLLRMPLPSLTNDAFQSTHLCCDIIERPWEVGLAQHHTHLCCMSLVLRMGMWGQLLRCFGKHVLDACKENWALATFQCSIHMLCKDTIVWPRKMP